MHKLLKNLIEMDDYSVQKFNVNNIYNKIVSGVNTLLLTNAKANSLEYLKLFGACEQNGTGDPSPSNMIPIVCNNGELSICHKSGLPLTGYTKLDYVKNSSSTKINTNIIPTVDDIEIELRCKAVTGSWYMLQARASTSDTQYGLSGASSGSTINFSWGETIIGSDVKRTAGHILSIKATAKNGYGTYYVKDETSNKESFRTKTYSPASYPTTPIYLWGNNAQAVGANANVYYLKIKVSGETVAEYIPAKDSNDVEGFYDRVTNTFIGTPTAGTMTGGDTETDPIGTYVEGTKETAIVNYFDKTSMVVTKKGIVTTSGDTLGTESANNGYNCSTYIKVLPSTMYTTILPKASTISTLGLVYYSDTTVDSAISGVPLLTQISATYTFTTPENCNYIRFTWSNIQGNDVKLIQVGNTATAQNLFATSTYKDMQEVLTGNITRNVGIVYFTGEETWTENTSGTTNYFKIDEFIPSGYNANTVKNVACICSHFTGATPNTSVSSMSDNQIKCGYSSGSSYYKDIYLRSSLFENADEVKAFMKDQYDAGTPVIIVYPLSTSTAETVTGQTLTLQKGNNIISISQASLDNLELEALYKAEKDVN